jgi:peptide/nickel transport system substrate-binding protein
LFKQILNSFSRRERQILIGAIFIFLISVFFWLALTLNNKLEFLPKKGGQFREGAIGQPLFINPLISANEVDRDIASLIYSRLLDLSGDYQIEAGTNNYLVKLKQDLVWDDGQPLTSDDVVFTIKTIQDPDSRSPLSQAWQGVVAERISELQVRFILRNPYIFFPDNLRNLFILPQHIFGKIPAANLKLSGYNLEPVGSGPYKFENFSKEKNGFITEYQLTINENYSGKKPYLEKFIFKFYETPDALIKAFNQREVDGFGGLNSEQLKNLSLSKNLRGLIMPNYYGIFFNQNINSNLKDRQTRLALAQAIDKKQIIQIVFNGEAMAIDQIFTSTSTPDLAALKEKKLEFNLVVPQIDFLIKTAEIIKKNWETIGVKLTLYVLNPNDIINLNIRSRDYEMLLFGINLQNKEDLFSFWHSSQKFYPGLNLAIYGNPQADKLMEEIRQTVDPEERKIKLKTLQNIINQDLPAIFLYSPKYFYVSTKNLGGFEEKFLNTASDRFQNVKNWYVKTAWVWK